MQALVLLLPLFVVPAIGILLVKALDQKQRDSQRKTYRLSFPAELDAEQITDWLRSLTGTLRFNKTRLTGVPTVAFEMWASIEGIKHRIKVPWQHADYIMSQLLALVPGMRYDLEEEFPRRVWVKSVEVGLTQSSRQLRIFSPATTSASLLASVHALQEHEVVMMQWVMTPAIPTHPPIHKEARSHHISVHTLANGDLANRDEITDRRRKLEEPNVQAVLRIGSVAATTIRADHLIHNIRKSLSSNRTAAVRFHKRFVPKDVLQRRLDGAAGCLMFPMQLSTTELAALIAWPIGDPNVSGLPPALSRHLPTPESVPREGRIIGRSNFPGNERLVAIGFEDARKHVHVVGPTGVGKTVLLSNMMRQDIEHGYGVVLVENKGDLFHAALNYIPKERLKDVVVLDVNDIKRPVGFNILSQGDSRVVVDEIGNLFDYLYKETRSVWTREVLFHGLRTLVTDPKYTFVDLAPLLVPMTTQEIAWSDDLKRSLQDRELRAFWQRFDNQPRAAQDRITQPVMDRIWQLNARPEIRHIIGQSHSSFTMPDIIANNKILLVNLTGLPRDTGMLFGTLIMNSLWHAVKTTSSDRPTFLYLDEFQDFLNLPIEPDDMLAKARGFGLGMTLAHQHMGQLPTDMRQAISANARTKIVFQASADDAKVMSREFGNSVQEQDFMHLGRYEALAKIATPDGVSPPLTVATSAPATGYGLAREVITSSERDYGRPIGEVEAAINQRRVPEAVPKTRRPDIGSDGKWGQ